MAHISGPHLIAMPPDFPESRGGPWENPTTHKVYTVLFTSPLFGIWRADTVQGTPAPWTLVYDFAALSAGYLNGGRTQSAFHFDPATGILYLYLYDGTAQSCRLATYDTNTETFTTVSLVEAGGSPPTTTSKFAVCNCPDGSILVASNDPSGDGLCLYRYRGGAWEAKASISAGTANPRAMLVDSSGNAHVLYYKSGQYRVVRANPDNSVAYDLLVAAIAEGSNTYERAYSTLEMTADEYVIALPNGTAWSAHQAAGAAFVQAEGGIGGGQTFRRASVCKGADGTVYAAWPAVDWNTVDGITFVSVDEIRVAPYLGDGAWGETQVGVDFLAHEPILPEELQLLPDVGQYSHNQWLIRGTSNGLGVICDFLLNSGEVTCTIFYTNFDANAAPVPLVLDCADPPDGTVGVDYLHQLSITGGKPPYHLEVL